MFCRYMLPNEIIIIILIKISYFVIMLNFTIVIFLNGQLCLWPQSVFNENKMIVS